jgi:hypothetical protein
MGTMTYHEHQRQLFTNMVALQVPVCYLWCSLVNRWCKLYAPKYKARRQIEAAIERSGVKGVKLISMTEEDE